MTALGACLLGASTSLLTAVPQIKMEQNLTGQKLSWDAVEGLDFVLQGSDDAQTWTDLGLSVTQRGGTGDYEVLVPTNLTRKFYQLYNDGDPMTTEATKAYVGPDRCKNCHNSKYNDWADGGHPHKLNKVVDGQPPTYFSNDEVHVTDTPDGVDWSDVSYVIGGAIWKARFIGQDGYIITSTPTEGDGDLVQYNLANDLHGESWATYHTGEMKPYDCGRCHTTGWVHTDDGSINQEGMPGMWGSFVDSAITCEACHGPGSRHVRSGADRKAEITIDTSAEMCGNCHNRGGVNATIPAKGGFIRHHEQYNEMATTAHGPDGAAHGCVTCHDPHKSVKVGAKDGIIATCVDCHNNSKPAEGTISHDYPDHAHKGDASCIDCHMPRASKSAVAVNKYTGDIRTHIFKINTSATGQMFSEGGSTAIGTTGVTLDYTCYGCHNDTMGVGGGGEPLSLGDLSSEADNYHGTR